MGIPHTANALIEGGLLTVEVAIARPPHHQPTALLVEGPGAFSCNVPHQPLGTTLLRWRMLLTCNWRVSRMSSLTRLCWGRTTLKSPHHCLQMLRCLCSGLLVRCEVCLVDTSPRGC